MKKNTVTQLDRTDIRMLQLIQENARIPIAALAQKVALSPSACARRLRILEDRGVISGYAAHVNPAVIGLPMMAFVSVSLSRKSDDVLAAFEAMIAKAPEVMDAYLMTGRDDYLLRVVAPDLAAYERFVRQRVTKIAGVSQVETSFILRQLAARALLPVETEP